MNKKELMEQLYINKETTPKDIMEKLFCVAIINQGIDVATAIFRTYMKLRNIMEAKDGPES